jgi:hypothetical protein
MLEEKGDSYEKKNVIILSISMCPVVTHFGGGRTGQKINAFFFNNR